MSKNKTRLLLGICLLATVLVVVFLFQKINLQPSTQTTQENPITVSLTINYPEDEKHEDVISSQTSSITLEDGSTVSDALQLYCKISDIPLSIDDATNTIRGIDKIENDDEKTFREWTFTLNGETIDRSARDTVLSDGDKIEFNYVLNEEAARNAGADVDQLIAEQNGESNEKTDADASKDGTNSTDTNVTDSGTKN